MHSRIRVWTAGLLFVAILPGCASVRELAALREVKFAIESITDSSLLGIRLAEIDGLEDVSPGDLLRLTRAVRDKELPLNFLLHVSAANPEGNDVTARLVGLDWTLYIEDRATVDGSFDRVIAIPPGDTVDVPIMVGFNLYSFIDSNLPDMLDLALNIIGIGGEPKQLRLAATPTIETPIGPIQYPGSIDIVDRRMGRD